jgi:alanine racemase
MMWRSTHALISLETLRQNCDHLRSLIAPDAFFCPMVKANAYGHGLVPIARALEGAGVTHLGVALVEEGELLRQEGVACDILVFSAIESREAAQALMTARLTPVIGDFRGLDFMQTVASPKLSLHLEFNTGMNRFGFEPSDVERLKSVFEKNPQWTLAGLCTHFHSGHDAAQTSAQLKIFEVIINELKGDTTHVHVLNSSAALALPSKQRSAWGFRPGVALYGADSDLTMARLSLKPVLSFKTAVSVIHSLDVGQSVSYNATWTAARRSLIGVLPVGYGDGYARALSNKASVLCRGQRAPIVGTICMDAMMVDLTDIDVEGGPIVAGEPIVLIGEQGGALISAEELAQLSQTISYEVLTRIGERVPRVYR